MRPNSKDIAVDNLHDVEEKMREVVRGRKMNQTGRLVRTKTKRADGSDAAFASMLTKALLTGKVSGTIDTKGRRVKASVVYPRGSFEYSAAKNYLFKGPMSTPKSIHKITVLDVVQKYMSNKNLCQAPVILDLMKQKDATILQAALSRVSGEVTFSQHCTSKEPLPDLKSWIGKWYRDGTTSTWVTAVLHYYFGQVFKLKGRGVMATKIYSQIESYIDDGFLNEFAQNAARHAYNSGKGRSPAMVQRICKRITSTLAQARASRGGTDSNQLTQVTPTVNEVNATSTPAVNEVMAPSSPVLNASTKKQFSFGNLGEKTILPGAATATFQALPNTAGLSKMEPSAKGESIATTFGGMAEFDGSEQSQVVTGQQAGSNDPTPTNNP